MASGGRAAGQGAGTASAPANSDRRLRRIPAAPSCASEERLGRSGNGARTADLAALGAACADDESRASRSIWSQSSSALGAHEEVERSRPETVALPIAYSRRTRKSSKEIREAVSDGGGGVRSRGERPPTRGAPRRREPRS